MKSEAANIDGSCFPVLTTYLTDSPIAPLNKAFVEIPEPFCTSIDLYTATRHPVNEMTLYISDVPVEHLDAISGLVRAELRQIADKGVDMDRMAMVLRRERRQVMHSLEGRPESMVEQSAIGGRSPTAYDPSPLTLLTCVVRSAKTSYTATTRENSSRRLGRFRTSTTRWPPGRPSSGRRSSESASPGRQHNAQQLIIRSWRRYLVDAPTITINGKPSAALAKKIEKAEKARIKAQKTALGEAGLKAKEEELRLAKAFNDRDIPKEVLDSFGVPDVSHLSEQIPHLTRSDP